MIVPIFTPSNIIVHNHFGLLDIHNCTVSVFNLKSNFFIPNYPLLSFMSDIKKKRESFESYCGNI